MKSAEEQESEKSFGVIRRIAVVAILLAACGFSISAYWYSRYIATSGPEAPTSAVTVSIPRGSSVADIKDILVVNKIIHDDFRFLLLARFSGKAGSLQAGEFLLPTGRTPAEILEIISSARSIQYRLTIPEGLRATEIAEIFAAENWCDPKRFNQLTTDLQFISSFGLGPITSLEGYLYPDTYFLTKEQRGAETLIRLMVGRFKEVWGALINEIEPPPDLQKTTILASIVEKETGAAEERGLIAGVFHNRLAKGMPLQSDPTVIYGIKNFTGKITKKHLRTKTPYNTYKISGLPVGPISNPGRDALKAVLFPTKSHHLYFVSKNNGTHHFSPTLAEHNRAVRKYQRKKSTKKGK